MNKELEIFYNNDTTVFILLKEICNTTLIKK